MLSSVLKSTQAIEVSIALVRAFVDMKQWIKDKTWWGSERTKLRDELEQRMDEQDIQILDIYENL